MADEVTIRFNLERLPIKVLFAYSENVVSFTFHESSDDLSELSG